MIPHHTDFSRHPLIIGNWKMHGLRRDLTKVVQIAQAIAALPSECCIGLCLPATLLSSAQGLMRPEAQIILGGQDCHEAESGPYTGDISAAMLKDAGAQCVLLGHCERRKAYAEENKLIYRKILAAHKSGLKVILCVGESLSQRQDDKMFEFLAQQLQESLPPSLGADSLIIAYEPVWAIGTGNIPAAQEIGEVHAFLRQKLMEQLGGAAHSVPLLYGGSVTPNNIQLISRIKHVDGVLVGGASLNPDDFVRICTIYATK